MSASTTKLFRKGKSRMINKMLYLVKRRKAPRNRNYCENMLGKNTIRILDLLFQLANDYSPLHEVVFRENKPHLQEWAYRFLQELFQHRRHVHQLRLLKQQQKDNPNDNDSDDNMNRSLDQRLLNCDEIIDECALETNYDRQELAYEEGIPGPSRFSVRASAGANSTVYESATSFRLDKTLVDGHDNSDPTLVNGNDNSDKSNNNNDDEDDDDDEAEVTVIHKENMFRNVAARRKCIVPDRRERIPSPDLPPMSSTRMQDLTNMTLMPPISELSAINASPFSSITTRKRPSNLSPITNEDTVIPNKSPKLSPSVNDTVMPKRSPRESFMENGTIIGTRRRAARAVKSPKSPKTRETPKATPVRATRARTRIDKTLLEQSTMNQTSGLNQTHDYSLRERSRIDYTFKRRYTKKSKTNQENT